MKKYIYRISPNIRRGRLLTFEQSWGGVYWREACKRGKRLFWNQTIKFDKHAVGVYQHQNNLLVGHIPIELSSQIHYFLEADKGNFLKLEIIAKQKREVGLVVAALFIALTTKKSIAINVHKELKMRKKRATL